MNLDKEALRLHYQRLSDEDIERLANFEAADLTPEAIVILKEEIRRRGLSNELDVAADIQISGVSRAELLELVRRISMFPCPTCGKQQGYLNAFNILSIRSYILVTNVTTSIVIACPGCISKSAKAQLARNLLFGWWGIPWGADPDGPFHFRQQQSHQC